ncbi:MAG TPA: hypothetical protein VIG94_05875 [Faecalibacter sp.]
MKQKLNVNQIPNLKQEILDLPEKEKNQLLIRLINKDQVLIEQLHFRLLENEWDLIQRFEALKEEILETLNSEFKKIINAPYTSKGKAYLRLIRGLSSKITHFAKVTKSTSYELELRTLLLIHSSKIFKSVQNEDSVFGYKSRAYQVTKIKSILKLLEKMHEDLRYDFLFNYSDDLELHVFLPLKIEIGLANLNIEPLRRT